MPHTPYPRKGHADLRSTNIYLHADMTIKQRALERTTPNIAITRLLPPLMRLLPSSRACNYAEYRHRPPPRGP